MGAGAVTALQPPLYLPVPLEPLWACPNCDRPSLLASSGQLAARLANLAVDLTTTDSPTPADVQRELGHLSSLAAACVEDAKGTVAALAECNDRDTSDTVTRVLLAPGTPTPTIERYVAYDRYFNVVRTPQMTEEDVMTQVLAVTERLLRDLPRAFLARDEIISLLTGLAVMISGTGTLDEQDFPPRHDVPAPARPGGTDTSHLDRWVLGHHIYFLATGFCRRFLDRGLDETQGSDAQASQIGIAGSLLRATTAAMWYASELSPASYINQVRPSMPPDGFSGEHNADHVLLRSTKDKLLRTATIMANTPEHPWPDKVRSNMERFLELDLEDTEAHILLAASKVGRQPSLAQSAAAGDDELPRTTAVDMLRTIGKHKQSVTTAFFQSQLRRRGHLHAGSKGPDVMTRSPDEDSDRQAGVAGAR